MMLRNSIQNLMSQTQMLVKFQCCCNKCSNILCYFTRTAWQQ